MSFIDYCNRYFVGQDTLVQQLSPIIESIKDGEKQNILLTAQSGYGKTYLADLIARYTKKRMKRIVGAVPREAVMIDADTLFLDEIHLEPEPEFLYPHMDDDKYSFVLATNEYDKLKEPVRNRCFEFIFGRYSESALASIILGELQRGGYSPSRSACLVMAEYARRNPRVAKSIARRLVLYFKYNRLPRRNEDVHELMAEALSLGEGGFTERDYEYIDFLKGLGGMAGLRTIKSTLNIPEKVITHEIEPFLISKGLLEITSRGRRLKDDI